MLSATDHFNTDFATMCKKIPRYSGELTRQMADRFIAQHYFHGVLVHRVVKLSFSNKFSPINGSIRLDKHDIHAQLMRKQTFPCCVVTKLSFLYRSPALYFHSNSTVFISTVGFSNEDNCCQSGGIGNRLKRYFESLTY